MIEPQVVHGGASSWFWIAANEDDEGTIAPVGLTLAVGVAGVFIETHHDPDKAPSDGPTMVPFTDMPALLEKLIALDRVAKGTA